MKTSYLNQLTKIAKRAAAHRAWQPASVILAQRPQPVLRHVGTAY